MEKELYKNDHIETIDIIKFFAAIAVCLIHYKPYPFDNYFSSMCKWAVPFFFIISGYFLSDSKGKWDTVRIKQKIIHISKLVLLSGIVYFAFFTFNYIIVGGGYSKVLLSFNSDNK